jgi:hypothetical protein
MQKMNKLKTIYVPHGSVSLIAKALRTTRTTVNNALKGANRTELALKIRDYAIKEMEGAYARN